MDATKAVRQMALLTALCAGLLAMNLQIAAQPEPTAQQATIDAMVEAYFDQTATATALLEQTQTLQAAFAAAQTATAAFDSTVQVAFEQAATATQQALPTPTPVPVPERVVATSEIDLTAGMMGQTAFLAPSGEQFAHIDSDSGVCIYTIMGELERCIPLEGKLSSVNTEWLRWSADSRMLVFTEDFFIRLDEPDLWIINVEDGGLTNISDDNEDEFPLAEETDTLPDLDLSPVWTDDGRVAFLRYNSNGEGYSARLMAIDPETRELEELTSFGAVEGLPITTFDLAPDESFVVYNWMAVSSDWANNGLRLRDLQTGEERVLFTASQRAETPFMLALSANGQYVLWMDARFGQFQAEKPEDSGVRVLAIDGGDPMLVDANALVYAAWWAPQGEALAYIVHERQEPESSGLFISSVPGEPGRQVLEGLFLPPVIRIYAPIMWSANNAILLSNAPEAGLTVVQLGD